MGMNWRGLQKFYLDLPGEERHHGFMHISKRPWMIRTTVRLLPAMASLLLAGHAAHAAPSMQAGWEESGEATWYGGRHHGRRTSMGTVFDQNAMTAAHSSLPLGTKVRVTMQETGASVVVTITDRQPHKFIRVIDLAKGAASRIGLLSRGTAMVTLSAVRPGEAEEVEVAEASGTDMFDASSPSFSEEPSRRRGQPRMRRAVRVDVVARPSNRGPSATPVRHSAPRRAALRTT